MEVESGTTIEEFSIDCTSDTGEGDVGAGGKKEEPSAAQELARAIECRQSCSTGSPPSTCARVA